MNDKEWAEYLCQRNARSLPVPNYVERYEGAEIVAWDDVPEKYQKKILSGTMTEEDWTANWSPPVARDITFVKRNLEDVVSDLLNADPPVAKYNGVRHLHVFRNEYPKCMLKGCNDSNPGYAAPMVGN